MEKVTSSEWAAPVVVVPKGEGRIRLCGDYKVTVNKSLEVDQHPLPKPDELFAALAGGVKFSKIDLTQAYQQMVLDQDSRVYVTINTHLGLFRYTRLPFGIASAPAIFQRTMETILQGVKHVQCYIDDILITGSNEEEHLHNLEEVLKLLSQYGIRVKEDKCAFFKDKVEYLGHQISSEGLHTAPKKVEAIQAAPTPANTQELRSFLGLLHYYGKFIPDLASLVHPLNKLLQAGSEWRWTSECEQAFALAKKKLTSATVLAHYNPRYPLRLAADASSYGLGAVISHVFPSGVEKPIAYASRTLTASERNYSQLEKEALSLVFAVQKFHQYLYGREFTLCTDHKPLTTILGPKKGIPPIAAARLQRWALQLAAHNYTIQFRPTKAHANADALSRLPLKHTESKEAKADLFSVGQIEALPVTSVHLKHATSHDPILSKVLMYTKQGWPDKVDEILRPYWNRRTELTLEGDCIMWGIRVVVSAKLQDKVLEELHRVHLGISKAKALARNHVWWPGIDVKIEQMTKACERCQAVRNSPPAAPLHPWSWPSHPWQRIHLDFAGPFCGKMFFVIVDSHSKWAEVVEMKNTTSAATITVLRQYFATYGLPEQVVSDNGPQFTSSEFRIFLKSNGVKHIRCVPYHPSSNGVVERFIQTFKKALRAGGMQAVTVHQRLMNFLLVYRTTPHTTTGMAPCVLFLNRDLRTRFHLLRPDISGYVTSQQAKQKAHHDLHSRSRNLWVGQRVLVRNYRPGEDWIPGTVIDRKGPHLYTVQVANGLLWRQHIDQLKEVRDSPQEENSTDVDTQPYEANLPEPTTPTVTDTTGSAEVQQPQTDVATDTSPSSRYPTRNRKVNLLNLNSCK